jgi:hypothetical protein
MTASRRLEKAIEFLDAADEVVDRPDAFVTLCVSSGIASADVCCCRRLGEHAQGDDHGAAVQLLRRVDATLATDLQTLLQMKTRSAYGEASSSRDDVRRARRAAHRLLEAAKQLGGSPRA